MADNPPALPATEKGYNPLAGVAPALSAAQISQQAMQQANLLTNQQVAPMTSQISTLNTEQKQAAAGIAQEFKALQPVVQQGATAVQKSYDAAQVSQQNIFSAATANLSQMAQGQAQQAQMLAQQIGAPVAVENFTSPWMTGIGELGALGAGEQLQTLGYAQAGVQEAQAFAQQVFPLVRTEQQARNRAYYQNQVKEIRRDIAKVRAQKGALYQERYNELQAQEKQYALDRAQVALEAHESLRQYNLDVAKAKVEQFNANRDYQLEKKANQLERDKLNEAIYEFGVTSTETSRHNIAEEGLTGKQIAETHRANVVSEGQRGRQLDIDQQNANTALKTANAEVEHMNAQDKREATRLGMDKREYALRKKQQEQNFKLAMNKLKADNATTWNQLLEGALSSKVQQYSYSVKVGANFNDPDAFVDTDGSLRKLVEVKKAVPVNNIHDPNKVLQFLTANGQPRKQAEAAIRGRMGIPDWWDFGDKWTAGTGYGLSPTQQANAKAAKVAGAKLGTALAGQETGVGPTNTFLGQ